MSSAEQAAGTGQDEDGRIVRITDFWPDPYEPPAGRAHLAGRY
jgi:hypothetical protein